MVAGLVAEGLCREIVETHLPEHTPVLATILWDELIETLRDTFDLTEGDLPALALYRQQAQWVEPVPLAKPVCRDPDDDWVLAAAVAGRAEMVVSGDKDLLSLKKYQGVPILTPRQFIERQPFRPR